MGRMDRASNARFVGRLALTGIANVGHANNHGAAHAAALPRCAFVAALSASAEVASFAVITHPLDEGVRLFCSRWGFEDLPQDPHLTLIRLAVRWTRRL